MIQFHLAVSGACAPAARETVTPAGQLANNNMLGDCGAK